MTQLEEIVHGDKKTVVTAKERKVIVRNWNDRNRFHFNATLLGIPQPKTLCIDVTSPNQIDHYHIEAYPVVVKTAISTIGEEKTIDCQNADELQAAVSQLSGQDYQVQEWLDEFEFFNLTYNRGIITLRRQYSQKVLPVTDSVYQKIRGVSKRLIMLLAAGDHTHFELLVACSEEASYPLECRL